MRFSNRVFYALLTISLLFTIDSCKTPNPPAQSKLKFEVIPSIKDSSGVIKLDKAQDITFSITAENYTGIGYIKIPKLKDTNLTASITTLDITTNINDSFSDNFSYQKTDVKFIATNSEGQKKEVNYTILIKDKPEIVKEESREESNYLKGILPREEMGEREIHYDIFSYDRTGYPDSIKIYITVKDNFGNFVANLATPYGSQETEDEFFKSLLEEVDGNTEEITDFDVQEYHDVFVEPYDFQLVLDHSGSMYGNNGDVINAMQSSAISFIKGKLDEDVIGVVKFDHRASVEVPATKNINSLLNSYIPDGLARFGGGTALIGASSLSIDQLDGIGNEAVVLFTDGIDNYSLLFSLINNNKYSFEPKDLIYQAREKNIQIYTIGYANANKKLLNKLSMLTEAKTFFANDGEEISDIFESLPRLFQNYYVITYKPQNKEGLHNITAKVQNLDISITEIKGSVYIGDDYEFENPEYYYTIANFDYNDAKLTEFDKANMKVIIDMLKEKKDKKLEIHGHTDSQGNPKYNERLSKRRANNIKKYFVDNGISSNRIEAYGWGNTKPIHLIETYEWQARENRRVDLLIKDS